MKEPRHPSRFRRRRRSCVTGPTDKSRARLHEMTLTSCQPGWLDPDHRAWPQDRGNETRAPYVPAYRRVYPKFNFQSQHVYIAAGMYIQFCAVYYSLQLRSK